MHRFRLVSFALLSSLWLLAGCGDSGSGLPNETDVVAGWDSYGGDAGGRRHSPLDQITPDNVGALEVAWTYNHGDVLEGSLGDVGAHGTPASTTFQNTPILIDDTLYLCSPFNKVIALDAETGTEQHAEGVVGQRGPPAARRGEEPLVGAARPARSGRRLDRGARQLVERVPPAPVRAFVDQLGERLLRALHGRLAHVLASHAQGPPGVDAVAFAE